MLRSVAAILSALVLTLACSSKQIASDGGQTTTTQGASESGELTDTSASTSTDTTEPSETEESEGTEEGGGFVPDWDMYECSVDELSVCYEVAQDCPEGQKCVPFVGSCSLPRCVPITGDKPAGEPCTADELGGDDCDEHSWCYPGSVDTELPTECIPFCHGPFDELFCDDPSQVCVFDLVAYKGVLGCRPSCDPLMPETCEAWERCTLVVDQGHFGCVVGGGVANGDVCSTEQNCDSGACVLAEALPECAGERCCAPWCDLMAPSCAMGLECVPVEVDDPNSTVGVCALP